jgi:hypothetical protein
MQDSDEHMERLYCQFVPFGIGCNIIQTGDKPQQVKKLDPPAVPGVIVGYGPSTKQYRVMALHQGMEYKLHVFRHVIVNANHLQEYFARTEIPPALQVFTSVHCMHVLNTVSVPMAAPAAGVELKISGNDVLSVRVTENGPEQQEKRFSGRNFDRPSERRKNGLQEKKFPLPERIFFPG